MSNSGSVSERELPPKITEPEMGIFNDLVLPPEVLLMLGDAGSKKGVMHPVKIFFSGVSAGCLLSFAAASALTVTTSSWLSATLPGLARLLAAVVFPPGIIMVTLTGVDLCTTSFMFTSIAVFQQRLPVWRALLHWCLSFWGNLAGALFMVCIIFGYGGSFDADPWRDSLLSFATTRQLTPTWVMLFLRGIGCNWLVCLGCFFAVQGRSLVAKVVGLYFPIFTFVVLGLDHVVANMFFIPMSIWVDHPSVTVGVYIWKGILPVLLGNIIGGSLFCGLYHHLMYSMWNPSQHPLTTPPVKGDLETGLSHQSSSKALGRRNTASPSSETVVKAQMF